MNFQIIMRVFLKVYGFSHLHVWERTFLDNLKHWISIYQPPLSPPLLQSVVPDCGCKDKPISSPFPNFFTHFLKVFSINRDRTFLIRHLEQWFFIQSSYLTHLFRINPGKKKVGWLSLYKVFWNNTGQKKKEKGKEGKAGRERKESGKKKRHLSEKKKAGKDR